jgi:hypothetical protein
MTARPARPLVALATCAALPDLDPDEQLVVAPLKARGVRVEVAVWDDPAIDWARFDLVVIRSTWDYTPRRDEFVAWARRVPRLANPAEIVAWNTDKHYLADLGAAGVPVIPTTWLEPSEPVTEADGIELPPAGRHVIKPAIGAGSLDADTYQLDDPAQAALARIHAARLLGAGQTVLVQPYLASIDAHGETGLVYLHGAFSHAVNKGAMLGGEGREEVAGLYKAETITACRPSATELAVAESVLAAIPGGAARLTYARVDLVPASDDGTPLLIELELTEPSLFMATAPGSEERFAKAIVASLG